jgi:Ca2+-binding EF-hand superfamily protein
MWEKADKDSSGTLSYQEIVQVLQEMNINMSTKNIRAVFKKVDADNSNDLSYDEFIELIEKLRER